VKGLARFFALETRLLERLSTRIERFEHGAAFLDEEFRYRYNSNFLLVEHSLEGVQAEAILEEAERILGGASFPHREVVVRDDRHGERFSPAFAEHGYTVERNVIMAHRRAPDRDPDQVTEELSFADVRPLLHEIYRRQPWATSDEMVRVLTDQHGKFERVIGARFFAVRFKGTLAGDCELYVDGLDAQVENVATLEEFRGRGVARTVVLRAVGAAREAGAEHLFIVADEADWPRELYGRLGFDRIGRTWQFTRWPGGVPRPRTVRRPN
jgi:ribosomal protein S18 acetylase RimI-like enzyme